MHPCYHTQRRKRVPSGGGGGEGAPEERARDPARPRAPHTEADAAGVAQPPLPPRLQQMFIFSPVGSEMLSHSATSYQSQIISITCLLTLTATQPAARNKEVLQALPCLLEEIIIALRPEPWSSAVLNGGARNPPTCSPRLRQTGRARRGHPCAAGTMDQQQKCPTLQSGAHAAGDAPAAGRVRLLFGQKWNSHR